jgi:hypothetical protein
MIQARFSGVEVTQNGDKLKLVSLKALRQNHVRIRVQEPEPLRHDPDDFPRPRVDRDRPSDRGAVCAEPALPVPMRQNHGLRCARRIVRRREPPSESRRHSNRGKCPVCHD